MKPYLFGRLTAAFVCLYFLAGCTGNSASPENQNLILATTTSTQDSGLLDLLVPIFQEETGYNVQTIAVGTGAALRMAEEGNADVLLVHAPPAEKELMAAGHGEERYLVMHNDFVIIGPANDPAGIQETSTAAEALSAIATTQSPFVSRGDDSGTNKKELSLWQNTPFTPNSDKPTWYIESGQGMGASLIIASEKSAYIMTDRATYLANQQNLELAILLEGDTVLLNIYHVITVNPTGRTTINNKGAQAFARFMISEATQALIAEFGIDTFGQPLFFPDADKTDANLGLD